MQFVLASHNKKKLAELSAIVSSLGIEIIPLPEGAPEPEENGKTFEENALIKARAVSEKLGCIALADDSGLCMYALRGAPGIYSARFCGRHGGTLRSGWLCRCGRLCGSWKQGRDKGENGVWKNKSGTVALRRCVSSVW